MEPELDPVVERPSALERLAFRLATRAVRKRPARAWTTSPEARHILVVMPIAAEHEKQAWRLLRAFDLPLSRFTLLAEPGAVLSPPSNFVDALIRLEKQDFNVLGLMKRSALADYWEPSPDVTLCLRHPITPWAAQVAGAAPGAFRIGWWSQQADPFFDLLVQAGDDLEQGVTALLETLPSVTPPILPLR